jgi:hypothetical protein
MFNKFKIGDKVTVNSFHKKSYIDDAVGLVIGIVNGCETITGDWISGNSSESVMDCYILLDRDGRQWLINFGEESHFDLINSNSNNVMECPRCRTEMKEYKVIGFLPGSEYIGHKCSGCGYCS